MVVQSFRGLYFAAHIFCKLIIGNHADILNHTFFYIDKYVNCCCYCLSLSIICFNQRSILPYILSHLKTKHTFVDIINTARDIVQKKRLSNKSNWFQNENRNQFQYHMRGSWDLYRIRNNCWTRNFFAWNNLIREIEKRVSVKFDNGIICVASSLYCHIKL